MNKHRRKYLRDRNALEDALPFVAKEKTGPLDDFLDKEADEEGPLDGETFLTFLDEAGERRLDTEERERVLELLRVYAERGTKMKLVSLIRDALRIADDKKALQSQGIPMKSEIQLELMRIFATTENEDLGKLVESLVKNVPKP